jgi:sugar lactone lactonase YvrE
MNLADSAHAVIRQYPVDPDTGTIGAPQDFLTVDEGSPDGMTVDAEGAL